MNTPHTIGWTELYGRVLRVVRRVEPRPADAYPARPTDVLARGWSSTVHGRALADLGVTVPHPSLLDFETAGAVYRRFGYPLTAKAARFAEHVQAATDAGTSWSRALDVASWLAADLPDHVADVVVGDDAALVVLADLADHVPTSSSPTVELPTAPDRRSYPVLLLVHVAYALRVDLTVASAFGGDQALPRFEPFDGRLSPRAAAVLRTARDAASEHLDRRDVVPHVEDPTIVDDLPRQPWDR